MQPFETLQLDADVDEHVVALVPCDCTLVLEKLDQRGHLSPPYFCHWWLGFNFSAVDVGAWCKLCFFVFDGLAWWHGLLHAGVGEIEHDGSVG